MPKGIPKPKSETRGRPTKRTPEVIKKIEEVAALDGSVEEMAYYAGIHRETLYQWLKEDRSLSDRVTELRERPVLKARQTIVRSLDDPNHAFKYVERKRKEEFSLRTELTGAEGKNLIISFDPAFNAITPPTETNSTDTSSL